ncbi:hypothetical protein V1509DRAFT_409887 [Lipomyces kononenkoae]
MQTELISVFPDSIVWDFQIFIALFRLFTGPSPCLPGIGLGLFSLLMTSPGLAAALIVVGFLRWHFYSLLSCVTCVQSQSYQYIT